MVVDDGNADRAKHCSHFDRPIIYLFIYFITVSLATLRLPRRITSPLPGDPLWADNLHTLRRIGGAPSANGRRLRSQCEPGGGWVFRDQTSSSVPKRNSRRFDAAIGKVTAALKKFI